jgi:chromosome segregation ATPase
LNQEQEIIALKAQIKEMQAEIETLKKVAGRGNHFVDVFKESLFSLAAEISDAHQKVNSLLYANPRIVKTLTQLENILGPANRSTPDAPPHS